MRSFSDFGNTPGASFEVRGDPRNIVYYQDIPHLPDLSNIKARLENSIYQVTGVDPYYRGRATNSVQTTGATQALQARVTMLTDNSRITMLEEFTEDITRLIIEYYFNYGGDEEYEVPQLSATGTNKVIDVHRLNFKKMLDSKVTFDYHIAASTLLPMNQANLFESAKGLYEMQGQYQFKKQIITEEELIRYSDFPQKDLWLQRLAKEDHERVASTLVADLTNFASIFSRLLAEGLSEEQAAQNAIQILIEEKNSMKQDPSLGMGLE
jgi:type I site-specific restriction-modification system R (restriction) subunit